MRNLINEFENFDLSRLKKYTRLISTKNTDGKLFPPYIPLIGKNYQKFKILIYGTAQNMGIDRDFATRYSNHFDKLVERLYYSENFDQKYPDYNLSYEEVDIGPYNQGVLPALAGIFIYTVCHESLTSFDNIQDHIAVSNYYKFSLHGKKDINPVEKSIQRSKKFDHSIDANDYWKLNDELVLCELNALKPKYVLAFHGRHEPILKNLETEKGVNLYIINDPAWILKGGGRGRCLKAQGSWGSKTSEIQDEKLLTIIGTYLEKLKNHYQAKKDAVKVYLLKYYLDWRNQL